MVFLILKHNGIPFAAITDGRVEDTEKHIRNGWPSLVEVLANITVEARSDLTGVVFSPPPETERDLDDAFIRKSRLLAFNHENRLRTLEGKAAITKAQFRAALAAL